MKLLTQEIRKTLPPLYAGENDPDPVIRVKFFTPWAGWTWYATEFDGEDTFFGLTDGHEKEWGYFSLSELEALRGPFGLRIERDLHFGTPLASTIAGSGCPRKLDVDVEERIFEPARPASPEQEIGLRPVPDMHG